MRRLSFIRYLYQSGIAQSHNPAPLNAASILTLHDAVELFLYLAWEHLGVGGKKPEFMEYWDRLDRKLDPQALSQKAAMERLSRARASLKHHGIRPSDPDVESFRATAASFFAESCPVVFGVELADVSLIEFVNPESARQRLYEAQALITAGATLEALDKIALSYSEMIGDYEERNQGRGQFRRSPFYFGRDLRLLSSSQLGLKWHRTQSLSSQEKKLGKFVDGVRDSLEAMQDALKVLALGIDYRRYSKFKRLTPEVKRSYAGNVGLFPRLSADDRPSTEDAQFCLDFVIESALALAEFDHLPEAE